MFRLCCDTQNKTTDIFFCMSESKRKIDKQENIEKGQMINYDDLHF